MQWTFSHSPGIPGYPRAENTAPAGSVLNSVWNFNENIFRGFYGERDGVWITSGFGLFCSEPIIGRMDRKRRLSAYFGNWDAGRRSFLRPMSDPGFDGCFVLLHLGFMGRTAKPKIQNSRCSVSYYGIFWSMVVLNWEWKGSYTVEGTVIVSMICFMLWFLIMLGLYCHDGSVMKSTADELAESAAFWQGRSVHPGTEEVDYEHLKKGGRAEWIDLIEMGYSILDSRLLLAEDLNVSIQYLESESMVEVEIWGDFQIFSRRVQSHARAVSTVIDSRELPRNIEGMGDDQDEAGEP